MRKLRKRGDGRNKTRARCGEWRCSPKVIMVIDIDRNILILQRNMQRVFLPPEWLRRVVY